MKKIKLSFPIVITAFIYLIAGCESQSFIITTFPTTQVGERPSTRNPMYSWGFRNGTKDSLSNVRMLYWANGWDCSVNVGLPGGQYGSGRDPIPDRILLTWLDGRGAQQNQYVEVSTKIPDAAHFEGTIWFKFDGKTWILIPVTDAERFRRALYQLPELP